MKSTFLIIAGFLVVGCTALCRAELPSDPVAYADWQARILASTAKHKSDPQADSIEHLGLNLRKLLLPTNRERGEPIVREAIRGALLSIPGHAEYYSKRIKAQQAELEDALKGTSTDRTGTAKAKLLEEQMYGFATLKAMPSPETVRVLGEFLYDPWGLRPNLQPGENQNLDEEGITSHSSRALSALAALPLTYKPVQPREYGLVDYHQDIDAWKLWYEQVRAGTRTFRFIDDPREYNLHGPVASAVEPTVARQNRPVDDAPPAVVEESPQPADRGPIIGLFVALLLLVAAAWRVFRSRREGA